MLRRAGASLGRSKGHTRFVSRNVSLTLPVQGEDLPTFVRRVDHLLKAPGSHVYIDTSYLMWLIKIGPVSRAEFATWLQQACADRVTVPTWSLHELYRHHVGDRLTIDLDEHIKKLNSMVAESFPIFWTLFDEPLNGAVSVAHQRDQAREALRAVRTLTDRAASWSGKYDQNARAVIEFANGHAMTGSELFERLSTIEDIAAARFTGRIPPGFQDKRKRETANEVDASSLVVEGSNRWGDLIFWQEILDHARVNRVRNVFILTKDMKNDWRMAGSLPIDASVSSDAPSVQPPHPMLSFEAARTAGIQEVVLLDQGRLADIMKATVRDAVNFVLAARPPSLPPPKTDAELRSEAREREERDRAKVAEGIARASNLRFLDPEGMTATKGIIGRAVYDTRDAHDPIPEVQTFEEVVERAFGTRDIADLITAEVAAALGGRGLVGFARRLLVLAVDDPQWAAAAADLSGALETFPPATATFLYMGLLAATYLDQKNKLRFVPLGLVAQKLFAVQHLQIARNPIEEINQKASKATKLPLYLPSIDRPPIVVEFKIDTELDRENALRSLWVNDHDLLIDVQYNPQLQLARRIGGARLTPELALDHIADLYVLPRGQLGKGGTLIEGYTFDERMGFRAPQDVWRQNLKEVN